MGVDREFKFKTLEILHESQCGSIEGSTVESG